MLTALFKHADVLINHSSSTALESLIGETPVINIKYGQWWDFWKWHKSVIVRDFKEHYRDVTQDDPTYVVHSKRELKDALRETLNNPMTKKDAWQKTLQRMITTLDGTASEKVLQAIINQYQNQA